MPKHCEEDRFGFCPECREPNEHQGYLNVRKSHHMVCGKHQVTWPVGSGLFSSWFEETQEDWERNAALIASYKRVEPMYCQCADCVARRKEVRAEREAAQAGWEAGLRTVEMDEIPF